jgi:sec-independent protein translocase protein TatA
MKGGRYMFPQSVQTAGLGGLSGTELMVILGVAVLLFGGKKIPEVAKGLGEGIRNFKTAMKEEPPSDIKEAKKEEEVKK